MTNLVTDKVRDLADSLADLKVRLRLALAGELAQLVAQAVGYVVRTLVAGRTGVGEFRPHRVSPALAPAPAAAPVTPPTASEPPQPSLWSRIKAKVAAARTSFVERYRAAKEAVTTTTCTLSTLMPLRRIVLVAFGVGTVVTLLGFAAPAGVAAISPDPIANEDRSAPPPPLWPEADDANEMIPAPPQQRLWQRAKITASFPRVRDLVFQAGVQAVRGCRGTILQLDRINHHLRFSFPLASGMIHEHDLFVFDAMGGGSDLDISSQDPNEHDQFDPPYQLIIRELSKYLLFSADPQAPVPVPGPYYPAPPYPLPSPYSAPQPYLPAPVSVYLAPQINVVNQVTVEHRDDDYDYRRYRRRQDSDGAINRWFRLCNSRNSLLLHTAAWRGTRTAWRSPRRNRLDQEKAQRFCGGLAHDRPRGVPPLVHRLDSVCRYSAESVLTDGPRDWLTCGGWIQ